MTERFYTDVAIPPGEHLADTLREQGMNQSELAWKMGRPVQAVNQIVNGSKAITAETALQLEEATGVPAHIWTRLEADYRLVLAKLKTKHRRPTRSVMSGYAAAFVVGGHARAGSARKARGRKAKAKRGRR